MKKENYNNLMIVRQDFAQCIFNHKVQEKACERNLKKDFWVKIINIILVFFVLLFLVLQAMYNTNILSYISSGITIMELTFLVTQLFFNFSEKTSHHKLSALKFLSLREDYKNFIVDIINNNLITDDIIKKRDTFSKEYKIISEFSGQTEYKDYKSAQSSLFGKQNNDEEYTWSDSEIDRFLPEFLRLKNLNTQLMIYDK